MGKYYPRNYPVILWREKEKDYWGVIDAGYGTAWYNYYIWHFAAANDEEAMQKLQRFKVPRDWRSFSEEEILHKLFGGSFKTYNTAGSDTLIVDKQWRWAVVGGWIENKIDEEEGAVVIDYNAGTRKRPDYQTLVLPYQKLYVYSTQHVMGTVGRIKMYILAPLPSKVVWHNFAEPTACDESTAYDEPTAYNESTAHDESTTYDGDSWVY